MLVALEIPLHLMQQPKGFYSSISTEYPIPGGYGYGSIFLPD
jgi:hypothetical protein